MEMALCASASDAISTNANPRDLPVNLSITIVAEATVPAWEKACFNESSVVLYGSPPTYNFAAILLLTEKLTLYCGRGIN
jgi:hypothetical protein